MKRSSWLGLLCVTMLAITLILPGCTQPSSPSTTPSTPPPTTAPAPKPLTLKFAYSPAPKSSQSLGWEWMGPELEKRTNGRVKIEYYGGEALFKQAATVDSLRSRVADISAPTLGTNDMRWPASIVTMIPTLGFPATQAGLMASDAAFLALYNKFPQISDELKDFKFIGYNQLMPNLLVSKNKEVHLPQDLKGLRVGGSGPRMKLVDNVGGVTVEQVPPDSYMNLEKGVVDAAMVGWNHVSIYKLSEIAKYYYDFGFGADAMLVLMNKDAWNAMSAQDQKILTDLYPEGHAMGQENNYKTTAVGIKAAKDAARTIITPTNEEIAAWQQACQPLIDTYIKNAKDKGVKEPESILAEWKKLISQFKP